MTLQLFICSCFDVFANSKGPSLGALLRAAFISCTHLCPLNVFLFRDHVLASICVLFLHCLPTSVLLSIHFYFYSSLVGLFLFFLLESVAVSHFLYAAAFSCHQTLVFPSVYNFFFFLLPAFILPIPINLKFLEKQKEHETCTFQSQRKTEISSLPQQRPCLHICRIIRNLFKKCKVIRKAVLVLV